jgi:hypothetical protein
VVWSARGTHASYAGASPTKWFDRVNPCTTPVGCSGPIWRTWNSGRLTNIGESGALLGSDSPLAYAGPWGGLGRRFRTARAPLGPIQQQQSFYFGATPTR